ncbi:fem-like protein associated to methicillin resistance, fragment [Paracholeplasma brassicae]|uniref:Fem-like protein associated to methicillin resistance n=1 Tax=Acholeplasma brassicae TaxID=61635 RepID=U4KM39_9MOLU|nr:peptidoglycan bridge formation glycyltransferase FemA/FemB family protein [Paracholeplasma brassicae]CCV65142.1 fem-like protein associated to methicillin resistance, fragment [Paracholeplasma brassicae]
MAFISTIGTDARYLYGSSLRVQDKLPPIGQYLHYEIIRYLKDEGYKSYDMGGIPNLPMDDNHQSYHVYKFKKGFGGTPKILSYDYKYVRFKLLRLLNR